MTFDEGRWQWHDINGAAAQVIIDVVKQIAAGSGNSQLETGRKRSF